MKAVADMQKLREGSGCTGVWGIYIPLIVLVDVIAQILVYSIISLRAKKLRAIFNSEEGPRRVSMDKCCYSLHEKLKTASRIIIPRNDFVLSSSAAICLCRQICDTEESPQSLPTSNNLTAVQGESNKFLAAGASRFPLTRIVNQNVAKAALLLAAVDPSLGVLIAGAHGSDNTTPVARIAAFSFSDDAQTAAMMLQTCSLSTYSRAHPPPQDLARPSWQEASTLSCRPPQRCDTRALPQQTKHYVYAPIYPLSPSP